MPLPWEAQAFRQALQRYYDAVPEGAWPNFVLGSHDEHRIATRLGPENARAAQMIEADPDAEMVSLEICINLEEISEPLRSALRAARASGARIPLELRVTGRKG